MGRVKLPAGEKKDAQLTLKMKVEEDRQLTNLAGLPRDKLAALFGIDEPPLFAVHTAPGVLRWLIAHAHRLLEGERARGTPWAQTGKSIPTRTAAVRLGIDDEWFRRLARDAAVVPRRDREGHRYSLADIARVREYMEYRESTRRR
jgi:hypothetical protein